MSQYVDGFVLPIPKDRVEEYRRIAEQAGRIWREHGALDYWECLGDDLEVAGMVSFPQLAAAKPDETVIFAWAVFASREQRDAANAKIMSDSRLEALGAGAKDLFDMKRMAYGGFKTLVHV